MLLAARAPASPRAGSAPHQLLTEHGLRRLSGVELDSDVREQRLEVAEAVDQVAARIASAEEAEDVVATLPQCDAGRPRVGSSSAWELVPSARLSACSSR